jgi:ribosomal protein L29
MADAKKNFKAMADDELRKELDGLSKALHGLRAQTVTSTVENKSQFRNHRRDIARILTEIRARELKMPAPAPKPAAAPAAAPAATATATVEKPAPAAQAPRKAAQKAAKKAAPKSRSAKS